MKRLISWFGHPLRAAWLAIAGIMVLGALGPLADAPRQDPDWFPYLARVPHVTLSGDRFAVTPVSDWSYDERGETDQRLIDANFNIAAVRNIWFMLEPQPGSQLAAHTLLIFEFPDDRLLGVTIEADIIKQKQPENNGGFRALSYGKTHPLVYGQLVTDHPIDLTRWQVVNCYMGRAGLINSGGASAGQGDLAEAVRTAVINKRAGGTGLISGRKAFQRPMTEGAELLRTIQDVYLDDSITIA